MADIKSYDDFVKAFDAIDQRPKLYNAGDESPLVKLSRFSRENPNLYDQFRQRMRRENEVHYNGMRLPWER